ncbi:MAG TPA: SIR2 family protein [Bryobacteraceae bacterium]|jgi:hypothetical protein|nr:SIR2 family protein [Bryobacteraceae bacterium]
MRYRSNDTPPTRAEIDRIIFHKGPSDDDESRLSGFLRRMRSACFLNAKKPLSPLSRLVAQYAKDGLVLFLGAGVSYESGIPNWSELSRELLLKAGVEPNGIEAVRKALPSYIAQFELAGQILGSRGFVEGVYRALYGNLKCKSQLESIPVKWDDQKDWPGWSRVLGALKPNKTLEAVGNLLMFGEGMDLRRNPQVHAVLTSNVDNLLELYCLAKSRGKRVLTWIDRASVGEHPDETPVYHLHGFLDARRDNLLKSVSEEPLAGDLQEITDELLPDLIFRESEYYESIASPVSFINHTPQSFFRRFNVLFIGTALEELNMRRWLHDSFQERVQHRTKFLREFYRKRYADAEYEAALTSMRHFWLRPNTEVDSDQARKRWRVPQDAVQRVMSNLGVQVVWCRDYDGIRDCLNQVRRSGDSPGFGRQPAPYRS